MTEVENRKIAHGRFSLYREHKLRFSAGKRRAPKSALGIRVWEPERFQGPKGGRKKLPRLHPAFDWGNARGRFLAFY